jgi:hypothetical protein
VPALEDAQECVLDHVFGFGRVAGTESATR